MMAFSTRRVAVVAALAMVSITAGGLVLRSDGPGEDATLERATTTTSPASSATSALRPPPVAATAVDPDAPVPGRAYLTIGTNDRRQFSEAEYRTIAAEYETVVFTKFHAGWEIGLHHEAARRLKELNPDLRVFGYMSTKYWFDAFRWGDATIDPSWFLRDNEGQLVPLTQESYDLESKELGYYVDPSNPSYRAWLVGVARSWVASAPYDGIRLDAADPIGDFGDRDVRKWKQLLSPERIAAYNHGIELLFREMRAALAPRPILFNGISPSPLRGPGRDLFMLDYTDGAMDENFCTTTQGELHDIVEDIEIMERYANKSLHLRARYGPDLAAADRRRVERACAGAFLMGWVPGSTYVNIGTSYSVGQLTERPPELSLDLGRPEGSYTRHGDVLTRHFERGVVHVNLGASPAAVDVPPTLERVDGGPGQPVPSGQVQIPPSDAVFLVTA